MALVVFDCDQPPAAVVMALAKAVLARPSVERHSAQVHSVSQSASDRATAVEEARELSMHHCTPLVRGVAVNGEPREFKLAIVGCDLGWLDQDNAIRFGYGSRERTKQAERNLLHWGRLVT